MSVYVEIVNVLFVFSTALLYPVIVALLLLFAWSLALLGSLISEYSSRRRDPEELEDVCLRAAELAGSGKVDLIESVLGSYVSHARTSESLREVALSVRKGTFSLRFEKILQDAELSMSKAVEPIRIGVRVGPILGLMGTLIPMGPALISLSQGDIEQMANSLVIAFSTTVIGLAVGGICYATYVVRTRWYRQDLSDLEYAVDILRGEENETAA